VRVDVEEHALVEPADLVQVVFLGQLDLVHEFGQFVRLLAGVQGLGDVCKHLFTVDNPHLLHLVYHPVLPVVFSFVLVVVAIASGVIFGLVVVILGLESHLGGDAVLFRGVQLFQFPFVARSFLDFEVAFTLLLVVHFLHVGLDLVHTNLSIYFVAVGHFKQGAQKGQN